jgi:hypothetical protein
MQKLQQKSSVVTPKVDNAKATILFAATSMLPGY